MFKLKLFIMTFKNKLMHSNKSPRRKDRKAGTRNKKIIKHLYSSPCYLGEIEYQKNKTEMRRGVLLPGAFYLSSSEFRYIGVLLNA